MILAALVSGALTLMAPWEPRVKLDQPGVAQAFQIASRNLYSQRWFTFAAQWDTITAWPQGQTIALSLKDGRSLEASQVMAMTPRPQCRPVFLGLSSQLLDPSQLEHGRNGRVVLLVSFPDPGIGLRDITGVQVRRKARSGAAPPEVRGSP